MPNLHFNKAANTMLGQKPFVRADVKTSGKNPFVFIRPNKWVSKKTDETGYEVEPMKRSAFKITLDRDFEAKLDEVAKKSFSKGRDGSNLRLEPGRKFVLKDAGYGWFNLEPLTQGKVPASVPIVTVEED